MNREAAHNREVNRLVRSIARAAIIQSSHSTSRLKKCVHATLQHRMRAAFVAMAIIVTVSELVPIFQPYFSKKAYAFENPGSLLPQTSQALADKLQFDATKQVFTFNAGYSPASDDSTKSGGPKITAEAYKDPTKGISVEDPINDISFGLKPKFSLKEGEKRDNRIVYPLQDGSGWLVYTMLASQVKEDIVLKHARGNTAKFSYEFDLGDSLEARSEKNGDIGIYGSSLPINSMNVSTGSDKDAELLQKVRQNAKKDKQLFVIPAPIIKESNVTNSSIKAHYEVKDKIVTLKVEGLKKGQYPLTIDPSVYVTSAQQFMQGNNESNIDFNTSSDLIQKGMLTGARVPSLSATTSLPVGLYQHATVITGGYIYVIGGTTSSSSVKTVYWARVNDTTGAIQAANPGNGACSTWCTNTAYNLPDLRLGMAAVAYNGFLYVMGGQDLNCSGGNFACNTVYSSKLGANGEPNTWSTLGNIDTGRKFASAVAYNNKIYLAGGQTSGSLNGDTAVVAANVLPDGTLSTWSATGMAALPSGRWGHTLLQYNGYIYLVGGANLTTPQATVHYIKINSDGTLSNWVSTTSFSTGRSSLGGTFATIYGGYMYILGGCSGVTNNTCTSVVNDMQLSSINADGSITNWQTQTVTQTVHSYSLAAWRGELYIVGGCNNTTCTAPLSTINFGSFNSDGDISNKVASPATAYNTPSCRVSTTTDCDLPVGGTSSSNIGRISQGIVVLNGWLYNIGGCTVNGCGTLSIKTARAQINADGSLTSWTTDTTNLTTGIAAFAVTTYNNNIVIYGGVTTSAVSTAMYRTAVNANGSLAGWNTITSATHGITTGRASSFIFARANPASAGTGYLYVIGGCVGSGGSIGCTGYYNQVYRCAISAALSVTGCVVTGQLQLDANTAVAGSQGLGIFGGAVYGNYIYLAGGASGDTGGTNTVAQTDTVYYAKLDASLNIVDPTSGHTAWPYTTQDAAGTGTTASTLTQVRRRTYAFVVNGYLYVTGGHDGTSGGSGVTLQDVVYGKIDQKTGNITSYSRLKDSAGGTNVITARWDLRAVSANGYLYMIGGCTTGYPPGNCGTAGNQGSNLTYDGMNGIMEYVQVYNNYSGSPASYNVQSSGTLPSDRYGASSAVVNGKLYIMGGCTGVSTTDCDGTSYSNDISYATINSDGTISTNWTSGATMPATRALGCSATVNGLIYYIGGSNALSGAGSANSTVWYYDPVANTWSQPSGASLPAVRAAQGCAVYNGRIYVVGGNDTTPTYTNTVYYSANLASGGSITSGWSTANTFTGNRNGATTIAYGNNLYVLGGYDGTNYLLDVQYALINSDGTIGSWGYGTSLPQAIRQGAGFAANGYMYMFGGRSAATTCTANTYIAPVNANPIVNKVIQNNVSPIGNWSQTSVAYGGSRQGLAAVYDSGRAYLFGGMCNGTLTTTNRVVYGALQSQPQVSTYSIRIDTDTNVFPSKFLFNGIDNGVGAKWSLKYQSSVDTTNSWGTTTNYGALTLGTPGSYTALDGSGTDTKFARYYYINVTVDASQSFGFPEDTSRGPTIDDFTFQYASAPSKRLRNGKTFTNGQQQPLDTPF